MNTNLSRRQLFRAAGLGLVGASASGWFPLLAEQIAAEQRRRRHCILLWMPGGPSHMDTFDLKPDHENGGEFKPIQTSVPGLEISEHLPLLSQQAEHLAVVRGLSTKEGDHSRGTFLMRTGRQPVGPIRYPSIGSALAKELGQLDDALPNYVSISPYRAFNQAAYGSGYLGPGYAPLTVGATDNYQGAAAQQQQEGYAQLGVDDLQADGVGRPQVDARLALWRSLEDDFLSQHRSKSPLAHSTVYERAIRMMHSEASEAFDLDQEPDEVRERYGSGRFGQGCLMARRLVERGVGFVEVSLGRFGGGTLGWDTHRNNFPAVKALSGELDQGWATLMEELAARGLLESTTIIWLGEFGRTPKINRGGGRDHYNRAWSCVLAGGGIQGGQAHGATSPDGTDVADGKVDVGNVLATVAAAAGVDPQKQNLSGVGRPIRIADGEPIKQLLRT